MRARAKLLGLTEVELKNCTDEELDHILIFDPVFNTFIFPQKELGSQYSNYTFWLPKEENMMLFTELIFSPHNIYSDYLNSKNEYCNKIIDLLKSREGEYLQ